MLRAMLSLRLLALLCLAVPLSAAEYYVAVNGNETNAGTLAAPFASVQRAQKTAAAGDTVWVRGGTYAMTEGQIAQNKRIWAYVLELDKSGSAGKPISYLAYRDEQPVFDFANVKPDGCRVTAFHVTGSWLHFKGLTVTGVQVTILTHTQSICFDNQGSNNIYESLTMHDGQAIGFWLGKGSNNLVLNCDAYRNYDTPRRTSGVAMSMGSAFTRRRTARAMSSGAAARGSTATTALISLGPARR